jgi:hypothetical protein
MGNEEAELACAAALACSPASSVELTSAVRSRPRDRTGVHTDQWYPVTRIAALPAASTAGVSRGAGLALEPRPHTSRVRALAVVTHRVTVRVGWWLCLGPLPAWLSPCRV